MTEEQRQQHSTAAQQASFKVGHNYAIVDVVGEGAYGVVWCVWRGMPRTRSSTGADLFLPAFIPHHPAPQYTIPPQRVLPSRK